MTSKAPSCRFKPYLPYHLQELVEPLYSNVHETEGGFYIVSLIMCGFYCCLLNNIAGGVPIYMTWDFQDTKGMHSIYRGSNYPPWQEISAVSRAPRNSERLGYLGRWPSG